MILKNSIFKSIILLNILLCSCTKTTPVKPLEGQETKTPEKNKAKGENGGSAVVQTIKATTKILPRIIEITTSLVGRKQVDVYARVSGRVSFIGPNEGDTVKVGDLLFKVDRTDPSENYQATPIESPIAGLVGMWRVTTGAQVSPQDPVVLIVDDSVLKANISLPVSDWSLVTKSTKIKVKVGNKEKTAKISAIARAADPLSGRGSIEIEIENKDRQWKSGMLATTSLEVEVKPRLLLPAISLTLTDLGTFVYAVENGLAMRKKVSYILITNDTVEITSGVNNTAEIIIAGNNGLTDKTPVKITNQDVGKGDKK